MKPNYKSYILVYALCLALFAGCYWLMDGEQLKRALLLQVLILWLLNEIWNLLIFIPVLLRVLLKKELQFRNIIKLSRLTSPCLIIVPPVIYGFIYLLDSVMNQALSNWLEMPLASTLFLSSYLSCVILFILNFPAKIMGISIINLLEAHDDATSEIRDVHPPSDDTSRTQESQSRLGEQNRSKVEQVLSEGEEILHQTAPIPYKPSGHMMQTAFGTGCSIFTLFILFLTCKIWDEQTLLVRLSMFIFIGIGALISYQCLTSSRKWLNRLSQCDFFITKQRFITVDGGKIHSIYWADRPKCRLTQHEDGMKSILIIKTNSLGSILAERLPGTNTPYVVQENGKTLNGLIHIPDADAVYTLIKQYAHETNQS